MRHRTSIPACPGIDGTAESRLGPPASATNQENTSTDLPKGQSVRHFLSRDSVFPDDSSLCQGDPKLASRASSIPPSDFKEDSIVVYMSISRRQKPLFSEGSCVTAGQLERGCENVTVRDDSCDAQVPLFVLYPGTV